MTTVVTHVDGVQLQETLSAATSDSAGSGSGGVRPPPELFTSDGLSLDALLERCAPHNSEGEGELQPVRGLSMWLRYEAGGRKGMWREVWPFRDDESGFNRRFFRALEVRASP